MFTHTQLLAIALLSLRRRIDRAEVTYPVDQAGALAAAVRPVIGEYAPGISETDLHLAIRTLLIEHTDVYSWYQAALGDVEIRWSQSKPTIDAAHTGSWLILREHLDENVLLAYHLARRTYPVVHEPLRSPLSGWKTLARYSDYDLETTCARGMADLHLHLGGMRLPDAVWLDLMSNEAAVRRYPALVDAFAEAGGHSDSDSRSGARAFATFVAEAKEVRTLIHQKLTAAGITLPPLPVVSGDTPWSSNALYPDRMLMIEGWRMAGGDRNGLAAKQFLRLLDRYCYYRNVFSTLSYQPSFEERPGLRAFTSHYFRRLSPKSPKSFPDTAGLAYRASERLRSMAISDAYRFLGESEHLKRVELRLAPMERVSDYWRFFQGWERIKRGIDEEFVRAGRSPISVEFAIHFKRTRAHARAKTAGLEASPHPVQLLRAADRHSAVIRAALQDQDRLPLLSPLARIDLAGDERDTLAATFGLHFRLLREDPEALAILRHSEARAEWTGGLPILEFWARLLDQGRDHSASTRRPLGLTVHAGEDFADRLEGLYQIASVLDACGARSGDGIGHGLALAAVEHAPDQARSRFIEAGADFESLCWLAGITKTDIGHDHVALFNRLDNDICYLGNRIFGAATTIGATADDFIAVWQYRFVPSLAAFRRLSPLQRAISANWYQDGSLRNRDLVRSVGARLLYAPLVDIAHKKLTNRLVQQRIVLELNPSSNIRVSGASDHRRSVLVGMFDLVRRGLLATINTDDPGIFSTCIENEYAIMLDAARHSPDANEREIRDVIELMRRVGIERRFALASD